MRNRVCKQCENNNTEREYANVHKDVLKDHPKTQGSFLQVNRDKCFRKDKNNVSSCLNYSKEKPSEA